MELPYDPEEQGPTGDLDDWEQEAYDQLGGFMDDAADADDFFDSMDDYFDNMDDDFGDIFNDDFFDDFFDDDEEPEEEHESTKFE